MNPEFDSDFEAQLSQIRPAAPSTGLKQRIAAELAMQMQTETKPSSAMSEVSSTAPESTVRQPRRKARSWRDWMTQATDYQAPWFSLGWTRWLAPAAIGVLTIGLFLPQGEIKAPDMMAALPEAAVFTEVPMAEEVSLVYQDDHTPMKVIRTSSQASYTWQDPESKSEITTTFPREHILISHIDPQ
ncbi:MAG: hypothetical protein ACAI35_20990 [Candidatus Methylacidiphilales bacterium]|nr:hypothetical protein [Candidatus Methylacidiphilales bacterium]